MRIYLPATVPMLQALQESGKVTAVNGIAFCLTPALRESYTTGTAEELEYVAMLDAARASLRLLANDPQALARRVVVSADIAEFTFRPDLDNAVVMVDDVIPMEAVAAIHMDTSDAENAVRAAVAVIDAADLGDEDAEFVLGDAEDYELSWYASQELPFLLELM